MTQRLNNNNNNNNNNNHDSDNLTKRLTANADQSCTKGYDVIKQYKHFPSS